MCHALVHQVDGIPLPEGIPPLLVIERRFATDQLSGFVDLNTASGMSSRQRGKGPHSPHRTHTARLPLCMDMQIDTLS